MIFFVKSYLPNNLIKSLANVCPKVSNVSKTPIAKHFGYQLAPKTINNKGKNVISPF